MNTKNIKQNTAVKLTIFIIVAVLLMLLTAAALQYDTKVEVGDYVHSKTNLSTVYYDNYHDLFGRLRDKNTITSAYKNTTTTFTNPRQVGSCSNNTSSPIEYTYAVTSTTGHTITANISVHLKLFEAEAGYTFQSSKTVSQTVKTTISPRKTIIFYERDIQILHQKFKTEKQPQVYVISYDGESWEWIDDPKEQASSRYDDVIQYDGFNLYVVESDIID